MTGSKKREAKASFELFDNLFGKRGAVPNREGKQDLESSNSLVVE